MQEPQDRPANPEGPSTPVAVEAPAHPWLDALTEPFAIELAEPPPDDPDATPRPRCGAQISTWWTRLI
ncbi:hypothetical protein [Solimonas terrae]|uniref:Uncharacterized protein n=1 Tax=Solimonas terrae TaxID=1396819 RepID=A0A6M2BW73_9GAMM|nr:hypothetical protein [Solimonas terrae]NGY06229.1 hypothetical protein [Solimonas terrae]